jgi:hypothetical protein
MKGSSAISFRLAVIFIVQTSLFAPLPADCEHAPPTCKAGPDSYLVVRSTFDYFGVSASYAGSVYYGVRRIVSGYLAESPDGMCFFIDGWVRLDSPAHDSNKNLSLDCALRRLSNTVFLSVRIVQTITEDVLLSFETSAPFFSPASAMAEFAEAFPVLFSGQVVRQYQAASPPTQGFWVDDGGALCLENVTYTVPDLMEDLRTTQDLPPSVMTSVTTSLSHMRVKRTIDSVLMVVFGGGGLGIGAASLWLMTQPNTEVKPAAWFIAGGGILVGVLALVDAIHAPRPVAAALNDWQAGQ